MRKLDKNTIAALAELACDIEGPYERKGYQLEELLEAAGWPGEPQFDGISRVAWLKDVLLEQRDDVSAVERFVNRLCDPLEYGDSAVAEEMRQGVNRILEPEGLEVVRDGRRTAVVALGEGEQAIRSMPEDIEERLRQLIDDDATVDLLTDRAKETQACTDAGAHTMAVIGLGSFLEGVLHSVIRTRMAGGDPEAQFITSNGGTKKWESVGLADLIRVGHDRGWIQPDARDFSDNVREYRNMVHPRQQLETRLIPDEDTVMLCWGPVRAVLNDLAATQSTYADG